MAQQDIRYGGYATTPNDRDCPDGPLATSINLINEDGALQPLIEPDGLFTLPADHKLWCIHATAVFKHYIVETDEHELAWIDVNNISHIEPIDNYSTTTIHQVTTVGNTLCVLDNNGLHYILWQADNNRYTYLGTKPPMLELSFGLSDNKKAEFDTDVYTTLNGEKEVYAAWKQSEYTNKQAFEIDNNGYYDTHGKRLYFRKDKIDDINNEIMALVTKANALIQKEGHFYAPFFVRYCYRMYDGTMWMHSAPVFMPVSMPFSIVVEVPTLIHNTQDDVLFTSNGNSDFFDPEIGYRGERGTDKAVFRYAPNNVALKMRALNGGSLTELKTKWADIVKSIDIFVSLPVISEDFSEKITSVFVKNSRELKDSAFGAHSYPVTDNTGSTTPHSHDVIVDIPVISDDAYLDKIHSVDNFYKVASYDLDEDSLPTTDYEEVNIDKTVLPILATQETMADDYKSHNIILPLLDDNNKCVTSLYNNNKRLYVAAPKDKLFEGFNISTLVPYCTSSIQYNVSDIIVKLNTEEGTKTVHINSLNDYRFYLSANSSMIICCPLFYPDSRAVEMRVVTVLNNVHFRTFILPMKSLPMLNGAMTKGGLFINYSETFTTEGSLPVFNDTINYSTKLYISDVNNPFIFPSTGINSVGSGRITGIATVNEPVSTGQFGYSDIYIFTTDGLWVAKIGSDGGLTSIQPVKADVCISPESITQLSGSVLFATARGIMEVVGNQTVCISDILSGDLPVNLSNSLPHAEELHQLLGHSDTSCLNPAPFLEYVQGCRMIYDYTHQRIVVFNPTIEDGERKYTYAYVYSLKSKLWGMMYSDLSYGFNSYPDAMAVDDSNNVVTLSGSETVFNKQMFITRPMKLGATDTIKTIRDLIQRGVFDRGDVNTVLYGSRDLINWLLIGSSTYHDLRNLRGTGYKYFRIASVTSLAKGESLSGVTIEAVPKHTNLLI